MKVTFDSNALNGAIALVRQARTNRLAINFAPTGATFSGGNFISLLVQSSELPYTDGSGYDSTVQNSAYVVDTTKLASWVSYVAGQAEIKATLLPGKLVFSSGRNRCTLAVQVLNRETCFLPDEFQSSEALYHFQLTELKYIQHTGEVAASPKSNPAYSGVHIRTTSSHTFFTATDGISGCVWWKSEDGKTPRELYLPASFFAALPRIVEDKYEHLYLYDYNTGAVAVSSRAKVYTPQLSSQGFPAKQVYTYLTGDCEWEATINLLDMTEAFKVLSVVDDNKQAKFSRITLSFEPEEHEVVLTAQSDGDAQVLRIQATSTDPLSVNIAAQTVLQATRVLGDYGLDKATLTYAGSPEKPSALIFSLHDMPLRYGVGLIA